MELPFQIDLSEKVIVITGAGGVLCSEFAIALAKCHAKVALLDINTFKINELANTIHDFGGVAIAYQCNVLNKKNLENVREQIEQDFGKCSILINGAGGNHPRATTDDEWFNSEDSKDIKTFFDLDMEGIEFVFLLNYMGTLLPTQVFAQSMIGQSHCSIINISSMNALTPLTKIPAYSGAKAAISNLTQWLAVYFSKVGIRCNAIAPGFFVTKQNEKLLFDEEGGLTLRAEKIIRNTPLSRFGQAEELTGALLFLVDYKASSFVNGVVIPVDGGFSAYSGV